MEFFVCVFVLAVYLCKRTMQNKTRLELADYEAENLAKLQKLLSKKWEFIYMQAEAQIKVDKKRDKMERKILDSQERAFWDVYRPAPGCVNTTEEDIKKTTRTRRTDFPNIGFFRSKENINNKTNASSSPVGTGTSSSNTNNVNTTLPSSSSPSNVNTNPSTSNQMTSSFISQPINSNNANSPITFKLAESDEVITLENLKKEKDFLKRRLERRYVKTSKVSERFSIKSKYL